MNEKKDNVSIFKVNLSKIMILLTLSDGLSKNLFLIKKMLFINSIKNLSNDNLGKILNSLLNDKYVIKMNSEYLITDKGKIYLENEKRNILNIQGIILNFKSDILKSEFPLIPEEVEDILQNIIGLKTIPYTIKNLRNPKEFTEDSEIENYFFMNYLKNEKVYYFDGRGMGREHINNTYDYSEYIVLFLNQGFIKFIGFVEKYDSLKKRLILKNIHCLSIPISVDQIKKYVRNSFKVSQQKQEFYLCDEVQSFIALIKKNW